MEVNVDYGNDIIDDTPVYIYELNVEVNTHEAESNIIDLQNDWVDNDVCSSATDSDTIESRGDTLIGEATGERYWEKIVRMKVDEVPGDINGKCVYEVTGATRQELLKNCRDTRPWKSKDTNSKWSGYPSVRYKDCGGQLRCPNVDCQYKRKFGEENRLRFDKLSVSFICFYR